jgi:hypothetical protein
MSSTHMSCVVCKLCNIVVQKYFLNDNWYLLAPEYEYTF